jgi:hypothetical protein
MEWLRLYDDMLDDPKAQKLSPLTFKRWINLLCLANKGTVRGVLPPVADIAFRLRMEEEDAVKLLADLLSIELLDMLPDGSIAPHNWSRYRNSNWCRLPPSVWAVLRKEVFERDDFHSLDLHCDHILAVSRGGSNDMENLATACRQCNLSKGAKTLEEWLPCQE